MAAIKLVSLNVEKSRHIDRGQSFLREVQPDVFCVQELYESAIPQIAATLSGAEYLYEPMTKRMREEPPEIQGIAIFSRLAIQKHDIRYYKGTRDAVPDSIQSDPSTYGNTNRVVITCDVEKGGMMYRIATNHFAWTPDGKPDDVQREEIHLLLDILRDLDEFVLAGDFNAPRGGEIFGMLAARYRDNVPLRYKTSLDLSLHRAGKSRPQELLNKMVDGIFSTPRYDVRDVELLSGISDHCAIVANVSRAT